VDQVTEHPHGVAQIRLPMTGNPMKYVNAYLLEDEGGHTLIDCGWKAPDVRAALDGGLARLGVALSSVRHLTVTHAHFDHYGLAGTLRRDGVASLSMHPLEARFAVAMLADPATADAISDGWLARNGMIVTPGALEEDLYYSRTELAQPTETLADGERLGRLRAVHTPGHTPGHLCFVDERTGAMFTGDHVLPRVTPHVGMWHADRSDPLGAYLASLRRVRELGATRVYPAHLEPFDDLAARVDELLAHHAERTAHIADALAGGSKNAFEVAGALGWTHRNLAFAGLDPAHQQFAVAETLAHLEHMRALGTIERTERAGVFFYATA
jgi:glyoxylase-like metal-dependent hydrolase (beta-lactamase superfamily II)